MQTFLPYSSFEVSAKCLDRRRLWNQCNEVHTILKAMNDQIKGWRNHTTTNMWRGYQNALVKYGMTIYNEWHRRSGKHSIKVRDGIASFYDDSRSTELPYWFGNKDFHLAHQSNLIQKNPKYYRPIFGDDIPDDLPYIYPKGVLNDR